MNNYIIYTRVSTRDQGDNGLSLDAQKDICRSYINSVNGTIVGEYSDVESGSSRIRKGLNEALHDAKVFNATIVFSKLDRLARDSEFAHKIKNSGVKLYFCDQPQVDNLTFSILVAVAENELKLVSERTKTGLEQIKKNIEKYGYHESKTSGRRITKLGNPDLAEISEKGAYYAGLSHRARKESSSEWQQSYRAATEARSEGKTYQQITDYLNRIGLKNSRGGTWSREGVRKMLTES